MYCANFLYLYLRYRMVYGELTASARAMRVGATVGCALSHRVVTLQVSTLLASRGRSSTASAGRVDRLIYSFLAQGNRKHDERGGGGKE